MNNEKKNYVVVNNGYTMTVECDYIRPTNNGYEFVETATECEPDLIKAFAPFTALIYFEATEEIKPIEMERRFAILPRLIKGRIYWLETYSIEVVNN